MAKDKFKVSDTILSRMSQEISANLAILYVIIISKFVPCRILALITDSLSISFLG